MHNFIKEKRSQFSMTQEQLSERVGVSRQTIISIESGRYKPSLDLAFKIAKTFHCRIEDIFVPDEEA